MKTLTKKELNSILSKHKKWLGNKTGGERANLSWANLSGANLSWANLSGANLSGAYFSGANLSGADLSRANLSWANLSGADLSGANLSGANLSEAYLSRAELSRANLSGAENIPFIPYACPDFGAFIGYKKVRADLIVELEILSDARRCSATGRKCRCDKAKVISIQNIDGTPAEAKEAVSKYDRDFKYRVGEIVEVKDFCENRWQECSAGIHFFINRQEAVYYND